MFLSDNYFIIGVNLEHIRLYSSTLFSSYNLQTMKKFTDVQDEIFGFCQKKLEILKKEKQIFQDLNFPERLPYIELKKWDYHVVWLRSKNFLEKKNITLFDKIDSFDIIQGSLNNSYFLAVVSCLALKPNLIARLFQSAKINEQGFYCIWLCISGHWELIKLDDYFPTSNKWPIFSKPKNNKIWVSLLEKAYAKAFKGYKDDQNFESSLSDHAFRDLTGAPTKRLYLNNLKQNNKEDLTINNIWQSLVKQNEKGYLMTATTSNKQIVEFAFLDKTHEYSILSIIERLGIRLIRLRNPLGSNKFSGEWNQNSWIWNYYLHYRLYLEPEENGTFYITFNEFINILNVLLFAKFMRIFIIHQKHLI